MMIRITAPRVFQTRKGRCNTFNPRIVLSENRFRFSGRCDTACAGLMLARAVEMLNHGRLARFRRQRDD
ncbi:hypothetical protein EHI47_16955 [Rhizobium leguminosarum]|uniref:Uncharacterized protein n=2 Tax=Rhizobium TaxID=379 RepID=A0A444HYT4_RHILE|nr:hypothetical protein [Rhizobium leguminosarum bv. viciae]RWX15536.1 hypothetical protein EHI45_10545 [Rhizobium leguminosarum]TBE71749.1 hypothetical protein ELH03_13830 [Rhizobium beringeri]RWX29459.1 hypothetical protein EHI47_16955 [Rhizobium leguminosarum]TAU53858.1 hypothetical protein ELI43_14140 [Rhizobium leguminosarum]